jgi:GNAT superfamily N-acetyltransferase
MVAMTISWQWCGEFHNDELNRLHAEGFGHKYADDDWAGLLAGHSLGWVTARDDQGLIGFVNVVWDGQTHGFIEDTLVAVRARRQGVGKQLVAVAVERSREAGCEWLHVDFEDHLKSFYFDACGFRRTNAGLIQLR